MLAGNFRVELENKGMASRFRIEKLILKDFKSYEGEVEVPFDKKLTAVIGPNGCGKSNIMDGICFVLGLPSSYMRASRVSELIRRGGNVSSASVEILFTSTGENQPTTISFSRKITRTSSGSTYRIDGRTVTEKAYTKALEDRIDILVAQPTSFLIQQGNVTQIAIKASESLSALIEEIGGSRATELREKYHSLKATAEDAVHHFTEQSHRKRMVRGEKISLERQKNDFDRYLALVTQKKEAEAERMLTRMGYLTRQIDGAMQQADEHRMEEAEKARHLAALKKADAADAEHIKRHVKDQAAAKAEVDALKEQEAETDAVGAMNRMAFLKKKVRAVGERVATLEKTIAGEDAELAALKAAREAAEAEEAEEADEEAIHLTASQKKTKDKADAKWGAGHGALIAELRESAEGQTAATAMVDRAAERVAAAEETLKRHGDKKATLETKRGAARARECRQVAELDGRRKEHEAKKAEMETFDEQRAEAARGLAETEAELGRHRDNRHATRRDADMKRAVEGLRGKVSGVYGTVAELIRPKRASDKVAVAVGMGRHLESIVVDTYDQALACIDHLSFGEVKCRRRFLPLDSINGKNVKPSLRDRVRGAGGAGGAAMMVDLLNYDTKFAGIAAFVTNNTIVVDGYDAAVDLAWPRSGPRARVVTREGTMLAKNGAITSGGNVAARAQAFKDADLVTLERRHADLTSTMARLTVQRQTSLADEIDSLARDVAGRAAALGVTRAELERLDDAIMKEEAAVTAAEALQDRVEGEHAARAEELTTIDRAHQKVVKRHDAAQDKVYAAVIRAMGGRIKTIRELDRLDQHAREASAKRRLAAMDKIARLDAQIDLIATGGSRRTLEGYTKQRALIQTKLDELEAQTAASKETQRATAAALEEHQTRYDEVTEALQAVRDARATRHETFKAARAVRDRAREALTIQEQRAASGAGEREKLFDEARFGQIDFSRYSRVGAVDGDADETQPMRRRKRARTGSTRGAGAGTVGTYDLTQYLPDTGATRGRGSEGDEGDRDEEYTAQKMAGVAAFCADLDFDAVATHIVSRDACTRHVAAMTEKIAGLAKEAAELEPNTRAADQLESVTDRLDGIDAVFAQLSETKKAAQRAFDKVKEDRTAHFTGIATKLNKAVQRAYRKLTDGGAAEIQLGERGEGMFQPEGVQLRVMPTNKTYVNMSELSGGEKTMVALALLFAIREIRPAPFYVMDEVDAALDGVNVFSVVDFVQSLSSTQVLLISLKRDVYQAARLLVGVTRPPQQFSQIYTLSLTEAHPPTGKAVVDDGVWDEDGLTDEEEGDMLGDEGRAFGDFEDIR